MRHIGFMVVTLIAVVLGSVAWASPAWAKHGNPEKIRFHRDRINQLQGERPALRVNRDHAVGTRNAELSNWKHNIKPELRQQGYSKGQIKRMGKEHMAPSRANVRTSKAAIGENRAQTRYHKNKLEKLTTHKKGGGGGFDPDGPGPF